MYFKSIMAELTIIVGIILLTCLVKASEPPLDSRNRG
jgi:hypothetical protein